MVPVFGFGAKPRFPTMNSTSCCHCFPLTANWQDTEVLGLSGIYSLYNQALQNIVFSGPTFFAPCFRKVVEDTKMEMAKNPDNYTFFMLLTDGMLHDMQQTIDVLVEASRLPISIVIVGIGNEDFTNMHLLDDAEVVSSNGERPSRDVLQFVEMQKCGNDMEVLTEEVLKEIPDQITSYFSSINRPPNAPVEVSLNGVKLLRLIF